MNAKQDRQGVRRAADLEQKYSFGSVFKNQDSKNKEQSERLDAQNMSMTQFKSFSTNKMEMLQGSLTDLDGELESFQSQIAAQLAAHDSRLDSLNNRISVNESDIQSINDAISSIRSSISSLNSSISSLSSTLTNHSETLGYLTTQLDSLRDRVAALEASSNG